MLEVSNYACRLERRRTCPSLIRTRRGSSTSCSAVSPRLSPSKSRRRAIPVIPIHKILTFFVNVHFLSDFYSSVTHLSNQKNFRIHSPSSLWESKLSGKFSGSIPYLWRSKLSGKISGSIPHSHCADPSFWEIF